MNYYPVFIQSKKEDVEDTYIFKLVFKEGRKIPAYSPGQYCYLANPTYKDPTEFHPFSIASSPLQEQYLEFCIKVYGNWTQEFVKKNIGDTIYLSESRGSFVWNSDISHAVFLLGGIGISPIMSMLRYISERNKKPLSITMLYGNRTPQTIAYKKELEQLQKHIPHFRIVHIFSHISKDDPWSGYRGFITKNIIEKETDLSVKPTFFMVGPPVFLEKMGTILADLQISKNAIKTESLDITLSTYRQNPLLE